MRIRWTSKAYSDLARLSEFLAAVNTEAAARATSRLARAPERLSEMPRGGERLEEFAPREVRRLVVDAYEIHYEVVDQEILIVRIWHTRENR